MTIRTYPLTLRAISISEVLGGVENHSFLRSSPLLQWMVTYPWMYGQYYLNLVGYEGRLELGGVC